MGILSWIFNSPKQPVQEKEGLPQSVSMSHLPEIELYSITDDCSYFKNRDIISSLEFKATLSIRTSLEVLLHHGETFDGPPSAAPRYGVWKDGISPGGIWLFNTKSWAQLARESGGNVEMASKFDNMPEGLNSSDIGPIADHIYLPFLIEFRKIVESEELIVNKIKIIKSLKNISTEFAQIFRKLGKTYPGFPDSFFISQLCAIPGVGPKVATNLFRSGFLCISDLKGVELDRLNSVQGVGPATARKIKTFAETIDTP